MKNNTAYILTTLLLGWFLLPFVLITDMYPLLRFGMYAEPMRKNAKNEFFLLEFLENNQIKNFDTAELGFNQGHFQYIIRYFVYQDKKQQFFSQLFYFLKKKMKKGKQNEKNISYQNAKTKYKFIIYKKTFVNPQHSTNPKEITQKIAEQEHIF